MPKFGLIYCSRILYAQELGAGSDGRSRLRTFSPEPALNRPVAIAQDLLGAQPNRRSRDASPWSMPLLVSARQWFDWLVRGLRMRRTIRVLTALDDRTLGDIGLAREDIGYVAQHGGVPPSSARKAAAKYARQR